MANKININCAKNDLNENEVLIPTNEDKDTNNLINDRGNYNGTNNSGVNNNEPINKTNSKENRRGHYSKNSSDFMA